MTKKDLEKFTKDISRAMNSQSKKVGGIEKELKELAKIVLAQAKTPKTPKNKIEGLIRKPLIGLDFFSSVIDNVNKEDTTCNTVATFERKMTDPVMTAEELNRTTRKINDRIHSIMVYYKVSNLTSFVRRKNNQNHV